jgi:non-canonical (house-cleaning) NTP pyrophosphatase
LKYGDNPAKINALKDFCKSVELKYEIITEKEIEKYEQLRA